MFKATLTALAALLLVSGAVPAQASEPSFINLNAVKSIMCAGTDGEHYVGTGFVFKKNRVITADHVVFGTQSCTVDRVPVRRVVWHDQSLDVAVLEVDFPTKQPTMELACERFHLANLYLSVGYAHGTDLLVTKLVAEGTYGDMTDAKPVPHLSDMNGFMYRGMSGGPVVDGDGAVVGINVGSNEKGYAAVRALSETPLCAGQTEPQADPLYPAPPVVPGVNLDLKLPPVTPGK